MFRGTEAVRFCSDRPEAAVLQSLRAALGALGRVAIDRTGVIAIEPHEGFDSALSRTALGGRVRRELNEYRVRIDYACLPSPAGWAVVVLGTPALLLGWLALLAPLAASRRVGAAVRQALGGAAEQLGGAPERRYGRKSGDGPR